MVANGELLPTHVSRTRNVGQTTAVEFARSWNLWADGNGGAPIETDAQLKSRRCAPEGLRSLTRQLHYHNVIKLRDVNANLKQEPHRRKERATRNEMLRIV